MKHISNADKSLLVGDEAAEVLVHYAAVLASHQQADSVEIKAIGSDGDAVVALFLLNSGTNLIAESASADLPAPDNADAVAYMNKRIQQFENPPSALPDDESWRVEGEGYS